MSDGSTHDERLDALLADLVDGRISDVDHEALAERLRNNEDARRRYHEYMELHALLRWSESEPTVMPAPEASPAVAGRIERWMGWAVAALLCLGTAGLLVPMFTGGGPAKQSMQAQVELADPDVIIVRGESEFAAEPGVAIHPGDIVVTPERGAAVIRYVNESTSVSLSVATRARFGAENGGKRIELLDGRVSCDVDMQPQGRPMMLHTRDARAVVLGTRFTLAARDAHTRLAVTEGAVRFEDARTRRSVKTAAGWMAEVGPQVALTTRRIADVILADGPVAYWRLNQPEGASEVPNLANPDALKGRVHRVEFNKPGPPPEQFPDFEPENTAANFDGHNDYITVPDPGADSVFDFRNGDSITLEAWINPRKLKDDTQVYIVGKGRTSNKGFPPDNHNWGLRIRGEEDLCKLSFIFRDVDNRKHGSPGYREDWHRWVSIEGFEANSGWHHVVVTYTFGKPESLRGYLDGMLVSGFWDYGGASAEPPVVDDDEVWIGSARGGIRGNSFDGLIDEVALYRKILTPEQVRNHFRRAW